MKLSTSIKPLIVEIICLLYILLFIYAAVSKFLDFEKFQVQLGQSPLLSVHALWVSWLVPIMELIIAGFLFNSRYKNAGLLASLGMMTMFTAYIFIILHYSSFVPCSCGGILQKMTWNTHLIFNCFFIVLAALAIALNKSLEEEKKDSKVNYNSYKWTGGIMIGSIIIVIILYLSSEQIMRQSNPFIRRYPQHPAEFSSSVNLKFDSYYFAGSANERIYLGNYKYPAYLLSMNQKLKDQKFQKIHFDPKGIPFKMITVSIQDSYFYLYDGSVPAYFRGEVNNWTITKEFKGVPYFTRAVPMDSTKIVFRSNSSKNLNNILGVFNIDSTPKIKYRKDLLQKQVDGIFDTDGTLLYSEALKKIVYVYFYRNEFIVADQLGALSSRGHTIDTVSHVKLKVSSLEQGKQYAMSSPSFTVNPNAAVCKNLLFVQSKIRGRFEDEKLWEKAFIIDLYDLKNNSYLLSFPLYHTTSKTLNSFTVTGSQLYAIIGNDLVVYELKNFIKKEINK